MGKVKAAKPAKEEKPVVDEDDGIGNVVLPEKDLQEKRAKKVQSKKKRADTGVVLLEGIPHGFYETQIHEYFSQFGEVRRIRVGRSKKTGNSKGYAFVEFLYPEVAQIAAEAMNNYMMFKQVLRTKYIPPAQQHPYMFTRNEMTFYRGHKLPKPRAEAIIALKKSKNSQVSQETLVKHNKRQMKKLRKLKTMYEKMDIEFDVDKVLPVEKVAKINELKLYLVDNNNAKTLKKKTADVLKKEKLAAKKSAVKVKTNKDVKPEKKSLPLSVAKPEKPVSKKVKVKSEKKPAAAPTVKVEKKKSVLAGRIEKKKKPTGAIKKENLQLAVKALLKDKKQAQAKIAGPKPVQKPQKAKKKANKK